MDSTKHLLNFFPHGSPYMIFFHTFFVKRKFFLIAQHHTTLPQ